MVCFGNALFFLKLRRYSQDFASFFFFMGVHAAMRSVLECRHCTLYLIKSCTECPEYFATDYQKAIDECMILVSYCPYESIDFEDEGVDRM